LITLPAEDRPHPEQRVRGAVSPPGLHHEHLGLHVFGKGQRIDTEERALKEVACSADDDEILLLERFECGQDPLLRVNGLSLIEQRLFLVAHDKRRYHVERLPKLKRLLEEQGVGVIHVLSALHRNSAERFHHADLVVHVPELQSKAEGEEGSSGETGIGCDENGNHKAS
jgi:hypothetical protein